MLDAQRTSILHESEILLSCNLLIGLKLRYTATRSESFNFESSEWSITGMLQKY